MGFLSFLSFVFIACVSEMVLVILQLGASVGMNIVIKDNNEF